MEKRAVIQPGKTPDIERKLNRNEKQSSVESKTDKLDDDFTKRAAAKAAQSLK